MSHTRDDYAVLGVAKTATFAEIKKAFHSEMLKNHPDKGGTDEKAKEIIAAYENLKNKHTPAAPTQAASQAKDDKQFEFAEHEGKEFKPTEFIMILRTMSWGQADQGTIEEFFKENVRDLEAFCYRNKYGANGYTFGKIFNVLKEETYCLMNLLNPELLKMFLNDRSFEDILNDLPVEHWPAFLDHLGRDWSLNRLLNNLSSIMGSMTGAANGRYANEYIPHQLYALFSYIGKETLRNVSTNPHCLGNFIKKGLVRSYGESQYLLEYLNGEDHWLSSVYKTGTALGRLLNAAVFYDDPIYDGLFSLARKPQLLTLNCNAFPQWNLILNFISADVKEKIFNQPEELSLLLFELDENISLDHSSKKLELFLERFVSDAQLSTLDQLIFLMNYPHLHNLKSEKPKSEEQVVKQNFKLIKGCASKRLYQIFLNGRTFDKLLSILHLNKAQPFYSVLGYAAARVYLYALENNLLPSASSLFKFQSYSKEEKIAAAKALIAVIESQNPIANLPKAASSGRLGEIKKICVYKKLTVKHTLQITAGESSSPQLKACESQLR